MEANLNGHAELNQGDKKNFMPPKSLNGLKSDIKNSDVFKDTMKEGENVYNMVQDTLKDINANVSEAKETAIDFVRNHPFYAVLGAAAIGIAAGLTVRAVTAKK